MGKGELMKILTFLIVSFGWMFSAFGDCRISFLTELSSRGGSREVFREMKVQRKLLKKIGFKYVPLTAPVPADYLLDLYYPGYPSRLRLKAVLSDPFGGRKVMLLKNVRLARTIRKIYSRFPPCEN